MNVADVMDGLAGVLAAVGGLQVHAYPPDQLQALPAGIVGYPDPLYLDATMGRGSDRADWPVHVVVSRVSDRSARDTLAPYLAGAGAQSVVAAVDDDPTLGGAAQSSRVVSVTGVSLDIGGVSYVAATFTVDVIG